MSEAFSSGWQWSVAAPKIEVPAITMRSILAEVCAEHRLPVAEVAGPRRQLPLVCARQDFMWRCRQVKTSSGSPRWSYPQIARFLGGMDHTTVIHGVKAHMKRMEVVA